MGLDCPKGIIVAEKEPFGFQKPSLSDQDLTARLDRVDELVNLMIDDKLDDPHIAELEGLISENPEARSQYVGMLQLHADLLDYYNPKSLAEETSPVLASLAGLADVAPPTTDQPAE